MFPGQPGTGASSSDTVMVKLQEAEFPDASVTRHEFVVVPEGKTAPEPKPEIKFEFDPGQLSLMVTR